MNTWNMGQAFVRWDGAVLEFGNAFYRRKVKLSDGYPRTCSLERAGRELLNAEETHLCDSSFFGLNMPGDFETRYELCGAPKVSCVPAPAMDAPHILVEIAFREQIQSLEFLRIFRVYETLSAYSVSNAIRTAVIPNCYWSHRDALSGEANTTRFHVSYLESCADALNLPDDFKAVKAVEFRGRTDYHNEMVIEHPLEGEGDFTVNGNLLLLQNTDAEKVIFLQEAPASQERRDFEKYDFRREKGRVHSCCWGISPTDLRLGEWHHGYRHVTILGRPEDDFSTLVKEYCAARFPLKEHEAAVLVNPWGCGHFPEWNCPAFMQEEIRAAGEAGAEVYQLDDSWQQCHGTARSTGIGLAEMTSNNRAMDMDFWKISPERLPDGFEPIVAAAEKAGIKLGLWCAPTYNSLYQDWEAFAEMLLDYHRRYGFATVKVDGVRLQRHEAEGALNKLLEKVRRESDGKVFFNLDTTNGQRPGYFYFLEYGNIFLENRYVYSQKVIGYHPEKTLRNLWMLSRYVRTQTLQVEVPAPDDIPADMEFVRDPREYSFEYWCAAAIFANMLIWTAPSRLSPENFAVLKKMIAVHKQLRRRFFNSVISPVGDCPDGRAISGLLSTGGCAVYFREAGCPNSTTELPHGSNHCILAGNGKITGSAIELPPCGYIILEFDTP